AGRLPALTQVPWIPAVGDGACSNLGSGCLGPEKAALMVGTSGALRVVSADAHPVPPEGLWCYRVDARRALVGGALSNGGNRFALIAERLELGDKTQFVATGAALLSSPAWIQMVCDVLGRPVIASEEPEASSHGAGLLALEVLGLLPELTQVPFDYGRVFEPN